MAVNYVIGDTIIRLKNASKVDKKYVDIDNFKKSKAVLEALERAGFITGFEELADGKKLRVYLKYRKSGAPYIEHVRFFSKPGRRLYVKVKHLTKVRSGIGVILVSTPKGILTSVEAKKQNVGGEIICEIW